MLNKNKLKYLYVDKLLSTTQISKFIGFPVSRIRNELLEMGILRSRTEGIKIAGRFIKRSQHA